MNAGFSRQTINAPPGTIMDGIRASGATTGSHDDLLARSFYIESGSGRILFLTLDLVFTERENADRIKGAVGAATGLSPWEILLNFSHTHAGPGFSGWSYGGPPDPLYVADVESACRLTAIRAMADLEPVRLFAASTQTRIPVSRRLANPNGKIEFRPNPDGEVCDALPFCMVRRVSDGSVKSLLFSVSCHPSIVAWHDTSADFPGVACAELNRRFHTDGAIFLQGCAGDTKPRIIADLENRQWRWGGWDDVLSTGKEIADAVERISSDAKEVEPEIHARLSEESFPLLPAPTRGELQNVSDPRKEKWVMDMLHRLERNGTLPPTVPILFHYVRFGKHLRFIGIEAEPNAPIGNKILASWTEGVTFPLGYTNGTRLYLPDDRQLAEGGYEAESAWEYHWPSNLAPGIDTRITEILGRLRQNN
jgi:hypothetical protein